ncbi:tyrosine-type recombinase/integrase [Micromonospora sp. NPDC020750]|uniref:tyrosine-type recombinase/integrase n=1 Tax=unclassified Micromonospora TaxID=2617518 RepID=UPI0037A327BF
MASKRGELPANLGPMQPYINSFRLALQVAELSDNTMRIYTDAATWFAGWAIKSGAARKWEDVDRDHLRAFFIQMQKLDYKQGYRNNIARGLQAFFKWLSEEEELPNPFKTFKPPPPPKIGEKTPDVISKEDLRALVKDAEGGRDFESRRDAALLRLFASTGCRLSEITHLRVPDVDVRNRTAVVTGKGNKTRTVKFDAKCALALDRYLRKRAEHAASKDFDALWFGVRRRMPMTPSGIRQVIERRGERLGLNIHPHLFRHTFSHNWLDEGGAEGDLMELNGWDSPQMLRHYGASAKAARARRAYDRIDVMRGV